MPSKRSNVEAPIQKIGIDLILECSVQARVRIDLATVSNYAERMKQKETFPPIIVYRNGEFYFLADGRHRLEAARSLGLLAIECEVRDGTEREALFYAVGSNANHGLPRTNADKRHCVGIVLNDAEWSKQSGREIARMCGVSNTFVSNVRRELAEGPSTIDSKASEAAPAPPGSPAVRRARAIKLIVELRSILRELDIIKDCGNFVTKIKKRLQSL